MCSAETNIRKLFPILKLHDTPFCQKLKFTSIEGFWGTEGSGEICSVLANIKMKQYEVGWVSGECLTTLFFFSFSVITVWFSCLNSCQKSLFTAKKRAECHPHTLLLAEINLQWPFYSNPDHCGSVQLFQHALVYNSKYYCHCIDTKYLYIRLFKID